MIELDRPYTRKRLELLREYEFVYRDTRVFLDVTADMFVERDIWISFDDEIFYIDSVKLSETLTTIDIRAVKSSSPRYNKNIAMLSVSVVQVLRLASHSSICPVGSGYDL